MNIFVCFLIAHAQKNDAIVIDGECFMDIGTISAGPLPTAIIHMFDATKTIDNGPEIRWQSPPSVLHTLTLDHGDIHDVQALVGRPRYARSVAMITAYQVEISRDTREFDAVVEGQWPAKASPIIATWDESVSARFVRLVAVDGVEGLASAGEVNVIVARSPKSQ